MNHETPMARGQVDVNVRPVSWDGGLKIFELSISEIWNYSRDNEKSVFFKESYAEGMRMDLNQLRTMILYLSFDPPDMQPFLNRRLAQLRGYAKAAREKFPKQWEFSNVDGPNEQDKATRPPLNNGDEK